MSDTPFRHTDEEINTVHSDLREFSREELTVMNRVLMSILHMHDFSELLVDLTDALNTVTKIIGGAVYGISTFDKAYLLLIGAGSYREYLPSIIPTDSNLHSIVSQQMHVDIEADSLGQMRLFDDQMNVLYCPILETNTPAGALAIVYDGNASSIAKAVLAQCASALGVLSISDRFVSSLSIKEGNPSEDVPPTSNAVSASLTTREKEVLSLISIGLSNKEIAARLYISPATCKNHVQKILAKLEVHSRVAAIAKSASINDIVSANDQW